MLVSGERVSDTCLEMIHQIGFGSIHQYIYSNGNFLNGVDFENDQKYFDCIYSPDPDILLKLKLRIPYYYDIPTGRFNQELNYTVFNKYYSQLGGAKAVFVNDKKMNRYAHWAGLNSFWVNEGINLNEGVNFEKNLLTPKKFMTPKLHIGYVYDTEANYKLIKNVISAKKSNWIFHMYNAHDLKQDGSIKFYNGIKDLARRKIYENCQIFLNPSLPYKNSITQVPSLVTLESMAQGCIALCGNIHDNADSILFDKYHYFKLDFIDANTIIETLRYVDKRREKLDNVSKAGRKVVFKYFDAKKSAKQKIDILKATN